MSEGSAIDNHADDLEDVLAQAITAEVEDIDDASEEDTEAEIGEPKKKRVKKPKVMNVEMLRKKFRSPIQGRQRKVQDWEDRTCSRLRALGFSTVSGDQRTSDFCTFELKFGSIRAVIRSEHSQWSSRGVLKFTDSAPAVEQTEVQTEDPK